MFRLQQFFIIINVFIPVIPGGVKNIKLYYWVQCNILFVSVLVKLFSDFRRFYIKRLGFYCWLYFFNGVDIRGFPSTNLWSVS